MSSLEHKMYNYEVTPPKNTWEKIARALDESHLEDKFPSKLNALEVTPPVRVWDKIEASLGSKEAIIKPITAKAFPWLRLAIAAAIAGIMILGIVQWMDNKNTPAEKNALVITTSPDTTRAKSNELAKDQTTGNKVKDSSGFVDKSTVAITGALKTLKTKKAKNRYPVSARINTRDAVYAYKEHTPNLAERYVMLMTPNGIVRMSKKLGNLVCCVAGDEQDDNCKYQIKTWQEKLATSSSTSTGNFMDILSLVSTLESEL